MELEAMRKSFEDFGAALQRAAESMAAVTQAFEQLREQCRDDDGSYCFDFCPDIVTMSEAERFIGQRPRWG